MVPLDATALQYLAKVQAPIAVALSGGADSVYLLRALLAQTQLPLIALHYDHGMRKTSELENDFCRDLCSALGIPFYAGKATHALHSEAEARNARYGFFDAQYQALNFGALVTGHHLNDVAETLLLRLARGSGTSGLAAPRLIHTGSHPYPCVRPLLQISKETIITELTQMGQSWCEDESNGTDTYFRNRVRQHVLPQLVQAAGKATLANMGNSRRLLQEDDDALSTWTSQVAQFDTTGALLLKPLLGTPRAIQRRALHLWLNRNGITLTGDSLEALLNELSRAYFKHSCKQGFIMIRKGKLYLNPT